MAMTTSDFSNALNLPLRKIFFDEYSQAEPEYSGWVNVNDLDKNYEEDWVVGGFGTVPAKTEGSSVIFQDAASGALKRYTAVSFGLGFRITWEMWEDDQTGIMKKMTQALARSFKDLLEIRAARILNNATATGSEFLGIDSKALLANDHPLLVSGGTFANMPTQAVDLGYTAVQAAEINFWQLTNHAGIPIQLYPEMALVSVNDMHVAMKLFDQEEEPDTANRNRNVVTRGKAGIRTYKVLRYLTDSDRWFLISRKGQHSLNLFIRKEPSFVTFDDPESGDVKVRGLARCISGFTQFYGVYGSVGA